VQDRSPGFVDLGVPGAEHVEREGAVLRVRDLAKRHRFPSRAFDEARGVREVYGWAAPASTRRALLQVRGEVSALRAERAGPKTLFTGALQALARVTGELLGARASFLPRWVGRSLSLERRG
jgi:hypothetical protein